MTGLPGLVLATGDNLHARVEDSPNPHRLDHVWITMDCGLPQERTLISVNTLSLKNRDTGFDPRVRVGILESTWQDLPPRGIHFLERFDYAEIEATSNIYFEHQERIEIEELLLRKCRDAQRLEAWGTPYGKKQLGIHQIHSRRASCAVIEDVIGLDGGLRFFYAKDRTAELVLFKFCGQT